ncbi:glucose dehydrogenase, partial [Trichonephila clavata]
MDLQRKCGAPGITKNNAECEFGSPARSVLAARLAEKECVTVLLLEAGKSPPKIPSYVVINKPTGYHISATRESDCLKGLKSVAWPRDKTIGGGSVISGMLNFRGNKKNYDDWAADGASGWSYEEVLPYFMKLEDNTDEEYPGNGFHGTGGPGTVSKPPYASELKAAVLEAAEEKGYRIGDINGPDATVNKIRDYFLVVSITMWDPSFPYNLTFEASYATPYATSQFLSLILLSMMGQKHTPKTTTRIKGSYDYII